MFRDDKKGKLIIATRLTDEQAEYIQELAQNWKMSVSATIATVISQHEAGATVDEVLRHED